MKSIVAPDPLPPRTGMFRYTPGVYPVPFCVIEPVNPSTSIPKVAPSPVPPIAGISE